MTPFDILVARIRRDRDSFVRYLSERIKHDGECVLWTGTARKGGATKDCYPVVWVWLDGRARSIYAHQVFWMLMNKRPTQRYMEIDHACKVHGQNCVRHLEEVSRKTNMQRMNERKNGKAKEAKPRRSIRDVIQGKSEVDGDVRPEDRADAHGGEGTK